MSFVSMGLLKSPINEWHRLNLIIQMTFIYFLGLKYDNTDLTLFNPYMTQTAEYKGGQLKESDITRFNHGVRTGEKKYIY